jgi:hypothetical protein
MLDFTGDGISELWKQLYPGAGGDLDSDGNGISDRLEAIAGTNPFDPTSKLAVTAIDHRPDEGEVTFHWQAVVGKRYAIDRFEPLTGGWLEEGAVISEQSGPLSLAIPVDGPAGIYRLRVADVDGDGDGLTAWEEAMLGLSDDSSTSSGQTGNHDYAAAFRMLEGTGTLTLADGTEIAQRPPVRDEVARFLVQASFGPDPDLIEHVMDVGIGGWLEEQLNPAAPTFTNAIMTAHSSYPLWWGMSWWRAAMTRQDQLRLKTGNALSQILVVSIAASDLIRHNSHTQAGYYDSLLRHSLGNYRDLLEEVTYSTQMGIFLSHVQNRKSDPSIGRFPDENFAREIMQLFSIGLWELNPDGSRVLGADGAPIPTYDNTTIMEMAKVFTGFGFGGPTATSFFTPVSGTQYVHPMKMWDDEHEPGEKRIVSGVVIPAGQTGVKDVSDALDALCEHPNIGPFIGRLLIQRFTTSNPSPDYVRRVADAWADNGAGVRGDMKAVVGAILMDPEARTPEARGDASGKVREPFLRMIALARAFKARNARTPPSFPVWPDFVDPLGQMPLSAPSVFNFYLPDHQPSGELRNRGLVSPELELATGDRLIKTDNRLRTIIDTGIHPATGIADDRIHLDFSAALAMAETPAGIPGLIEHLDGLLTWGRLSASTKAAVTQAVEAQTTPLGRVQTAVHLIADAPDFVVLK